MAGLFLLFLGVFTAVSLFSYDYLDPRLTQHVGPGYEIRNMAGRAGAYWAGLLVDFRRGGLVLAPVVHLADGPGLCARDRDGMSRWCGILLFFTALTAACATQTLGSLIVLGQARGGGYLGRAAFAALSTWLGDYGGGLLLVFVFVLAVQLVFGLSFSSVWGRAGRAIWWVALRIWDVVRQAVPALIRGASAWIARRKGEKGETPVPAEAQAPLPEPAERFFESREGGTSEPQDEELVVPEPPRPAPAVSETAKRPRKPRPVPVVAGPEAPLPSLAF
jgi:hypothetical protein